MKNVFPAVGRVKELKLFICLEANGVKNLISV
jgi:hypothetical protein